MRKTRAIFMIAMWLFPSVHAAFGQSGEIQLPKDFVGITSVASAAQTDLLVFHGGRGPRMANSDHIVVWDYRRGSEFARLPEQSDFASVAISDDGETILVGRSNGMLVIWDLKGKQHLSGINVGNGDVTDVAISRDAVMGIFACRDGTLGQIDVRASKLLWSAKHGNSVEAIAISPDMTKIASGGGDGRVRLWDAHDGRELDSGRRHRSKVSDIQFSSTGCYVVSTGSFDSDVCVWDLEKDREVVRFQTHRSESDAVIYSVAISPREDNVFASSGSISKQASKRKKGIIWVWDLKTGRLESKEAVDTDQIKSLCLMKNGRVVVAGGSDGIVARSIP